MIYFEYMRKYLYICSRIRNTELFINMEKKILTESEMKELLESNENLDNHCVDLETARKIIMDAILPLCK